MDSLQCGLLETEGNDPKDYEEETRCGLLNWHPQWLQVLASKKSYVLLFGLVGMNQLAIGSYSIATITTLEKRFKIPSQTSGIIQGGWDMGTIVSSITMAYIGSKGHKTRWVALGTLLVSLACFSQLIPYILFGPGKDAVAIANQVDNTTSSSSSQSSSQCGATAADAQDEVCAGGVSNYPSLLIFMSQVLLGIGTSMYWTLGLAYLDDNVKKNQTPMLISISATIRLFGSPIGFWLASKALELYVDPSLSPSITNEDARWIGAWWIGWIPLGLVATFFSVLLALFPRVLPRAQERRQKKMQNKLEVENNKTEGFVVMLKRLLKNRLLLCSIFSYVFYMFGIVGYWVFMPKYMETQFHMTASRANLVTGTMGLISSAVGVTISGFVVSHFKPSARKITGWNVIVEAIGALSMLVFAHLGCSNYNLHGQWDTDNSYVSWNLSAECNSQCNCGPTIPYEPVCDKGRSLTFYSPCHAGCTDFTRFENGTKIFTNCSCIPGTLIASDSFCPVDCDYNLVAFLVLYCLTSFLSSTSHSGLAIIQFRAVAPDDKSVSIALSEMLASVLAYIPGPIVYGYLVDSACLVWGWSCGERGNCWLYYGQTLRYYLNYTAAGFLSIALMFDCGVWYYSKNLVLFDDEENGTEDESANGDTSMKEMNKDDNIIRTPNLELQNQDNQQLES